MEVADGEGEDEGCGLDGTDDVFEGEEDEFDDVDEDVGEGKRGIAEEADVVGVVGGSVGLKTKRDGLAVEGCDEAEGEEVGKRME